MQETNPMSSQHAEGFVNIYREMWNLLMPETITKPKAPQ